MKTKVKKNNRTNDRYFVELSPENYTNVSYCAAALKRDVKFIINALLSKIELIPNIEDKGENSLTKTKK